MADRSIWGRGQISRDRETKSDLKASSLNYWGVDNEFQIDHAGFEVPSGILVERVNEEDTGRTTIES